MAALAAAEATWPALVVLSRLGRPGARAAAASMRAAAGLCAEALAGPCPPECPGAPWCWAASRIEKRLTGPAPEAGGGAVPL